MICLFKIFVGVRLSVRVAACNLLAVLIDRGTGSGDDAQQQQQASANAENLHTLAGWLARAAAAACDVDADCAALQLRAIACYERALNASSSSSSSSLPVHSGSSINEPMTMLAREVTSRIVLFVMERTLSFNKHSFLDCNARARYDVCSA